MIFQYQMPRKHFRMMLKKIFRREGGRKEGAYKGERTEINKFPNNIMERVPNFSFPSNLKNNWTLENTTDN